MTAPIYHPELLQCLTRHCVALNKDSHMEDVSYCRAAEQGGVTLKFPADAALRY